MYETDSRTKYKYEQTNIPTLQNGTYDNQNMNNSRKGKD